MNFRKTVSVFLVVILLFCITSCSYAEFEDRIKSGIIKQEQTKFDAEIKPDRNALIMPMGSKVTIDDTVTKTCYEICNAEVFDSFKSAGIKAEDIADDNAEEKSIYPFVAVDINVTVEKAYIKTDFYNIAVFHLLNKELFADPWSNPLPEMSYFSGFESNDSNYFHYTLAEGQTMTCRIGWIVDDRMSVDGLILHVGADITADNYVSLT